MSSTAAFTPLYVRGLRQDQGSRTPNCVVLSQEDSPTPAGLALDVGSREAHYLGHELKGEMTLRSEVLQLLDRVVTHLGARLMEARIVDCEDGSASGNLLLETAQGCLTMNVSPGQAVAVALAVGVPLSAESTLLLARPEQAKLSEPISSFLASLNLEALTAQPERKAS
jgi:bifunctional DNase/RNase